MKGSILTFKGSIVAFGIVGALALTLSATTSFAQAIYAGNSNLNAKSSLLMLVRGGHGGGGHGGGGFGGGMGGSFGGGGFGGGSFGVLERLAIYATVRGADAAGNETAVSACL